MTMDRLSHVQGLPLSGSFSLYTLAEGSEVISEAEEIHEVKSLQQAGDKEYKHDNLTSALEFYDEALEIDENNADILCSRASTYIKLRNSVLALHDAEKLVALRPEFPQAHYIHGIALDHLGRGREALMSFLTAISRDPQSSHISMLSRKVAALAAHFCDLPEKLLEKITDLDEYTVMCEVGTRLFAKNQYELSIRVLDVTQQLATNQQGVTMKLLLTLGNAHSAMKHTELALEKFQECLSVAVAAHDMMYQSKALVNIASLFLEMDDTYQAIIHYERLLALERELLGDPPVAVPPDYWTPALQCALHLNLSIAYKTVGDMEQALRHANVYVNLAHKHKLKKPAEARGHHNAGMLNEILGKLSEALEHYKEFVKMSKDGGDTRAVAVGYGCMGSVYAALKNVNMSLTYHEQHILTATKLGDSRILAAAHEQKGDTMVSLKKLDEAVECFMEMLKNCPSSDLKSQTRCLCKLGGAYRAQKRYQYSLYYFEQAKFVAEDFDYEDVKMLCEYNIALILQHSSQMYEMDQARRYLERLIPLFESKIQHHHDAATYCPAQLHTQLRECYDAMQEVLARSGDKEKALVYSEAFKRKRLEAATEGHTATQEKDGVSHVDSLQEMWHLDKIYQVVNSQNSSVLMYHLLPASVLIWVLQPGQGLVRYYASKSSKTETTIGEHIKALVTGLKKDRDIREMQLDGENRAIPRRDDVLERLRKKNQSLSSSTGESDDEDASVEDAQCKVEENLKEFDAKLQKPAARQLFDLLIAPIDDVLSKLGSDDSVVVIPDKQLHDCPFAAIQDWNGKTLSLRFCITHLPSLQMLDQVTQNEIGHLKRLDDLQLERVKCRLGGLQHSLKAQGSSNETDHLFANGQEEQAVSVDKIDRKRVSNPRLHSSGVLKVHSSPAKTMPISRETTFQSTRNPSVASGKKTPNRVGTSSPRPPVSTSVLKQKPLGLPSNLERVLGIQSLSTITTRTSTDTDITTSPGRLLEFHQVSSQERCTVIGNPSLPEVLLLHDRQWRPPGDKNQLETECHKVAALLDTTAVVGHRASKDDFLEYAFKSSVLHIATWCCHEQGALVLSPSQVNNHQGSPPEHGYLVTGRELCKKPLHASLVVLSGGWSIGSETRPGQGSLLPDAFLAAGAQCVLWLLWGIPIPALLKFYHHFYTKLSDGAYVSSALATGVKALQDDNRYSNVFYWSPFMLSGHDVKVNLRELQHAMLDQTIDSAEQAVHTQRGTDYLNLPPKSPSVTSHEVKLESIQKLLSQLLSIHNQQLHVIPALINLLDEALKRLHAEGNNHRTYQLPSELSDGLHGLDLLKLLDFHFQPRGAALSAPYVVFPHWDHDDLLVCVYDALRAILDISSSSACSQAVCEILPMPQDLLCHLVDALAITKHAPEVQLKVTDLSVKLIWRNNLVKAAMVTMGFQQIGLLLHFSGFGSNRRLLRACLQLFVSMSSHKSAALVHKLDVTLLGRPQTSKQPSSGAEAVRLPTLTPLILPRNQLRMTTPWLSSVEQPEEMDSKMRLARSKSDLASEYLGHMTRAKTWHQATVESQAKDSQEQSERPKTTPPKVKVIGGATASQNRVSVDQKPVLTIAEAAQRRDYSHFILQDRLDNAATKHKNDIQKLYLPHVQN